jgi:hypothetical protein
MFPAGARQRWPGDLGIPSGTRADVTGQAIACAIGSPLGLLALIFLPAGSLAWLPGWRFVAVTVAAFSVSALVMARVNPVICRARSRFQPGTKGWDKALLAGLCGLCTPGPRPHPAWDLVKGGPL